MKLALIITGIILIIALILVTASILTVCSTSNYEIKNHTVQIIIKNLSVRVIIDGEEKDKIAFNTFFWYNAKLTAQIEENFLSVKIERKILIGRPKLTITLNNKEIDFQNDN